MIYTIKCALTPPVRHILARMMRPSAPVRDILTKMMAPNAPVRDILAKMMCPDAPVRDILTKLIYEETFIFKHERLASTGARFSKPVRARTGSELQRERILSLGMKRELGRESEKTRREAKEIITTRYLIPSYTRAWWHDSKTA